MDHDPIVPFSKQCKGTMQTARIRILKEYEKEQQKKGDYRSTKETWNARD